MIGEYQNNPRLTRRWAEMANMESRELYPERDVVHRLAYIFERVDELEQSFRKRYESRLTELGLENEKER